MNTLKKIEIISLLQENNISFSITEHSAVYTIDDKDAIISSQQGIICRNLFLQNSNSSHYYLVTIAPNNRIDLKELATIIGSSRLSFVPEKRMEELLGISTGCVTPLALIGNNNNTITWITDTLLLEEHIGIHPNTNTATVWLSFKDLQDLLKSYDFTPIFL